MQDLERKDQVIQTEEVRLRFKERLPLSKYQVVITGGLSGIGKTTADLLFEFGADVIALSHDPEKIKYTSTQVFPQSFQPYELDLEKLANGEGESFDQQVTNLAQIKSAIRKNGKPVILIHSAAGGLEKMTSSSELLRALLVYQKAKVSDREAKAAEVSAICQRFYQTSIDVANKVNYLGPEKLTESLLDVMPEESWVIDLSSLWTTYLGKEGIEVPLFYKIIAETKKRFEDYLHKNAGTWKAKEVKTAIISGHLIPDTLTGNALTKFMDKLPQDVRPKIDKDTLPTMQDMAAAVLWLLSRDTRIQPGEDGVHELFVFEKGKVRRNLSKEQFGQFAAIKLPFKQVV